MDRFTRRAAFAAFRNTPWLTRILLIGFPTILSILLMILGIGWEHKDTILVAWDSLESIEDVYALVNVTGQAAADKAAEVLSAADQVDVAYIIAAAGEEVVSVGGRIWGAVQHFVWG